MNYKIVFLDMDGTLYQTENDIIQQANLDAINELRKQGVLVCAATGRPLNQMKLILERIKFDYMVLINGGYVLDKEQRLLYENPLKSETTDEIVSWCNTNKSGLMLHFGDSSYIYNNFYPMYYFCRDHHVLDYLFYDENLSYHKRHNAYNAVLMTKEKNKVDAFINSHDELRSDLIEISQDHFCFDIFNAGNDKSVGIEQILKKENLSWKDCVCFGDSTNDIQMLKKAGLGIAMGNANDYVKSFADKVTANVYDEGVAQGLKKAFDI